MGKSRKKPGKSTRPDMKNPSSLNRVNRTGAKHVPDMLALESLVSLAFDQQATLPPPPSSVPIAQSEEVNDEISCSSCVGACCRKGTMQELTAREAKSFRDSGNQLRTLHRPVTHTGVVAIELGHTISIIDGIPHKLKHTESMMLTAGHGVYLMENDCVFLEEVTEGPRCTSYEDRPGICRDFTVGGFGCQQVREGRFKSGDYPDWQPVELIDKPS